VTKRSSTKEGAGLLGIGVAACAVCCAGPILGFLAAIGIGTFIGVAMFGAVGLAIALLAIVPIARRRRAAASCETSETIAVSIGRKSS
jgi:mercuric ion transport protein